MNENYLKTINKMCLCLFPAYGLGNLLQIL